MLMTSNAETEPSREMHPQGGTENMLHPEPPETTTIYGDDEVIPEVKAKAMYKYKRGAWSKDEDEKLRRAVEKHGVQNWIEIEKISGLARPAKNCRLRWLNYLRPNLKRYPFTQDEERKIILLHSKYGNSWSRIASKLPGRSDNEIKNFWHKRTKRRVPSDQCSKYAPPRSSINENHSSDDGLPSSSQGFKPNVAKTPTSQLQKLLLSPNQTSQLCQSTDSPGESSNAFTFHINPPPILSSPKSGFRRFGKAKSQLSPPSHSVSGSASSLQRRTSLAIESPKSPLKLKLTPGVPAVYSVQMMTPTIDSPVSSSQFNPPIKPTPWDTDNSVPVVASSFTSKTELPPIQCRLNNSSHKVETDSDLEILDALREAQTRVRFLKKKLRLSNKRNLMNKSSRKENFLVQSPENTDTIGRNASQHTTKEHSSCSSLRVNAQCKNSRTEDLVKKISKNGVLVVKNASNRKLSCKLQKRENSEIENYSQDESTETDELIQGEISGARTLLIESSSEKESITYQEQRHSIDLFHDLNSQNIMNAPSFSDSWENIAFPVQVSEGNCMNECSSIEDLLGEGSIFLQDSFFMGDSFDQTMGTEGQLPHIDAFAPIYSQSTATNLVKSGYGNGIPSYHQPDEVECFGHSFAREFSYALERNITEEQKVMEANPLDSNYMVSEPIMEYGYRGGGQYSLLTSSDGLLEEVYETSLLQHQDPITSLLHFKNEFPGGKQYSLQTGISEGGLNTECTSSKTAKQDPSWEQSLNQLYTESGRGNSGEILEQELEHENLIKYFTTTIQTPEWYNNGNAIAGIEASAEFNTALGLRTYPEGFATQLQKMESSNI